MICAKNSSEEWIDGRSKVNSEISVIGYEKTVNAL